MALEDLQAQVPGLQACQLSLGAGLKLDILISSYIAITENGEKTHAVPPNKSCETRRLFRMLRSAWGKALFLVDPRYGSEPKET